MYHVRVPRHSGGTYRDDALALAITGVLVLALVLAITGVLAALASCEAIGRSGATLAACAGRSGASAASLVAHAAVVNAANAANAAICHEFQPARASRLMGT